MTLLILFAFIAGLVTILSPCILPILPIILSGSVGEGKRRPFGIVTGFILSFTFFTLALSSLVKATGLSADVLRTLAVGMIIFFGISLLVPQTQVLLEKLVSRLSQLTPKNSSNSGFLGGILVGLSLGLIWAPCVGPILASVITLAATSQVGFLTLFITLAYSLGTAIPMLAITYGGRQLLQKNPWLLRNTNKIQKIFGVVMILTGMAIFFNIDRQFQAYILEKFPQYGAGLTAVEDNRFVRSELSKLSGNSSAGPVKLQTTGVKAADFTAGGAWINSEPLSLENELKGKVVLVDFWTYSCINCIRTFPYLRAWHEKYKDKDFVIVGVHSPEFEFEKKLANVEKAVKDFELKYPVVLDNEFKIWKAYQNQYWPAHYLIDKNGQIRYSHFGEGKYLETENAIRTLLDEAPLEKSEIEEGQATPRVKLTPETYLGWQRAASYTRQNSIQIDKTALYQLSDPLANDAVGLEGNWTVQGENVRAEAAGALMTLSFLARKVHLVLASSTGSPGKVRVLLDGQPLPEAAFTQDTLQGGEIMVSEPRKYDILDLKSSSQRHTLELIFDPGIEAYAFTFGG